MGPLLYRGVVGPLKLAEANEDAAGIKRVKDCQLAVID
jgi:hypothetical protein